jgi:hypothetical protein
VLSKFVCDAKKLSARMRVCKRPYAQAIGRVELSLEELAANVLDLSQLQEARRWQQSLHVVLLDLDVGRVAKVYEQFHGVLVYVSDDDFSLPRLGQFVGEHGSEIGAARAEDDSVCEYFATADVENDIAEFTVAAQYVQFGEHRPGVFIGGVR